MNHIKIDKNSNCCGCNACREICPKGCIEMRQDQMGFTYPYVDENKCVDCGLCVHTCPFINPSAPYLPEECYAAVNNDDEQRLASSSGGVFVELARQTISHNGVVFGAVFTENWDVVHAYTETMEGVLPMMGSKYVQSNTSDTFSKAKYFLEEGKAVLYTGTPCQIAGLKHYLGKEYSRLLTVEVTCHGVPAPGVWQSYLKELLVQRNGSYGEMSYAAMIKKISFRSKKRGWKIFGFNLHFLDANSAQKALDSSCKNFYEPYPDNCYMSAFLRNWSIRPSCCACKAKAGKSKADITIGDFWGIESTNIVEDDDKGISCVICRTKKGVDAINSLENLTLTAVDYSVILQRNYIVEKSVSSSYSARCFSKLFPQKGFFKTMERVENPSILIRVIKCCRKLFRIIKQRIK